MYHFVYLGALIVSIGGMILYDMGHEKLLLSARRGLLPIASSFFILLGADIIGINLSIFHTNPTFVSRIYIITPDLPLEEILLLIMLPYLTLILAGLVTGSIKKP